MKLEQKTSDHFISGSDKYFPSLYLQDVEGMEEFRAGDMIRATCLIKVASRTVSENATGNSISLSLEIHELTPISSAVYEQTNKEFGE